MNPVPNFKLNNTNTETTEAETREEDEPAVVGDSEQHPLVQSRFLLAEQSPIHANPPTPSARLCTYAIKLSAIKHVLLVDTQSLYTWQYNLTTCDG